MTGVVRPLGIATLVLFFLAAFTPLPVRLYDMLAIPARIGPADAIVVLAGGGVLSDGELSDTSRRRAALGIELYRDGLAPLLVLSGAVGWRSESAARAALAGKCGVPDTAVLARAAGHTTHEEVATLGPLLRARGVRRALLVTDASHMRRAMRLLADAGFDVLPAPVRALDAPRQPGERIRLLHETLRESLALLYYGVAGYR
ncbi:MAG: YdcF family protein [Candidatus Rokuibacteriota bacterium]|nr:MAG: YdcF family protein [Candidatus Rokubacteria bacterium]